MDGKSHGRKHSLPDGRWRVAFAFDPRCVAILLVVGNKSGTHEQRFYRLERRADLLLSTLASYVAAMGGKLRFACRVSEPQAGSRSAR